MLSPSLHGIPQVDAYRQLRLPVLLVGDSKLGGISTTISSFESLTLRGYAIDAILLFREEYYRNWEYLSKYFEKSKVPVIPIQSPPSKLANEDENMSATDLYYERLTTSGEVQQILETLDEVHAKRIAELQSMSKRAMDQLWWPFVQHGLVKSEKDVTVIDSAFGDLFSVFKPAKAASPPEATADSRSDLLSPQFDGSASWWTQTFGHSHPSLASAAARAAGRYGHVMFPQAVHAPALKLAERMLAGPGKGWASKVFFSDDGSTAMEIALKMALRAYCVREGQDLDQSAKQQLGILGLKGSYHGDTIGAMDACDAADGVYTCEWHSSKGYWFDPPSVGMRDGHAFIDLPAAIANDATGKCLEADSLPWVYDMPQRLQTDLAGLYRDYIQTSLEKLERQGSPRLAALVLEPIVMGAGGMIFVDPLFQRVLIDAVRGRGNSQHSTQGAWKGLPVIFDEVFVGLYRIGWESCIPILGASPDIAVYAKTLTGGLVPLAVTLASDSVFQSFLSDKKADCLLHGHSYTAHAVGCEVANESLSMMGDYASSELWSTMQDKWAKLNVTMKSSENTTAMWSMWNPEFIRDVSMLKTVDWAMSLGTVLAIKVQAPESGMSHSRPPVIRSTFPRLYFASSAG